VALAAALGADCEIYSDVDGVYSADPRLVPAARRLEALSFEEMQALASAGAKVLNAQAVEFARERGIVIHARSTHGGGAGTAIGPAARAGRVKGVTCDDEVWVLARRGAPADLLAWLDGEALQGRTLAADGQGRALVVLSLQDVHGLKALRARLPPDVEALEECATVTCVGAGLNADWTVTRRALAIAAEARVDVLAVTASALQLTLLVPRGAARELTRQLHLALVEAGSPT
jgi:aspartate kinase